jgi:hypothetical protein
VVVPTGEHASRQGVNDGVLPFRLRLGVTGHRNLTEDPALARQIDRAIDLAIAMLGSPDPSRIRLRVISPLGEGADRLVARAVLRRPGATLEAALPLPVERYLQDFPAQVSRDEFFDLLRLADTVGTLPAVPDPKVAYQRVGQYVLDRCDILIALWDGLPPRGKGGTAGVVYRARARGVPVVWVRATPPFIITQEPGEGRPTRAYREFERVNALSVRDLEDKTVRQIEDWMNKADRAGLRQDLLHPFFEWIAPFYTRADSQAERYHRRFFLFGNALFLMAALAVAVVAFQVLFYPEDNWMAWFEVALMGMLLALLPRGRRRKLQWISCRFLAERFRSALFLAMTSAPAQREDGIAAGYSEDPSQEWLERAYEEAWGRRPGDGVPRYAARDLKVFLRDVWVDQQLGYYRAASDRNHRWHRVLTLATAVLFLGTVAAAVLHAVGVGHQGHSSAFSLGNIFIFASIVLPAFGAALTGIGAQREYVRNAERFRLMAEYLEEIKGRLETAMDDPAVHGVVLEVERHLLSENRDWIDVMRFHELELHV